MYTFWVVVVVDGEECTVEVLNEQSVALRKYLKSSGSLVILYQLDVGEGACLREVVRKMLS